MESRHDPNALRNDTLDISIYPDSLDEAEALARQWMAKGHSVGVGLSQLTAKSEAEFVRKFGLTIREALNPCTNMRVGATFYVRGALAIFNAGSATSTVGMKYAVGVMGVTPPPPRTARISVSFTEDEPVTKPPIGE